MAWTRQMQMWMEASEMDGKIHGLWNSKSIVAWLAGAGFIYCQWDMMHSRYAAAVFLVMRMMI